MHEFALADAVIQAVRQTADRERLTRVTTVTVDVGELQAIDREVFSFALTEVRPGDDARLKETAVTVRIEKAAFACRACGREFDLNEAGERDEDAAEAIHFVPELAHAFLCCPGCGSRDFEVRAGRGVTLAAVEGEQDDG